MKPKTMPLDDILSVLDEQHPDLEWEADRCWIWITSEIGPVHRVKGCTCSQCQERAAIRKALGRDGLGFIYAKRGHTCPSGAVSYWGHHSTHPIPFFRRHKSSRSAANTGTEKESVADAELLAMLG